MTVEILALDRRLLNPAFDLATLIFAGESTLHRALGIGLGEYRNYLRPCFEAMVDENLSVAAIDGRSGDLIGCLIVTDFHASLSGSTDCPSKFAPIAALTSELCRRYLEGRKSCSGETALVDMGAVATTSQGQGIYQRMRSAAHDAARLRGYRRVVGELSSAATQRVVLGKLGHACRAKVDFATFEFLGSHPFQAIKNPSSIVLSEGRL